VAVPRPEPLLLLQWTHHIKVLNLEAFSGEGYAMAVCYTRDQTLQHSVMTVVDIASCQRLLLGDCAEDKTTAHQALAGLLRPGLSRPHSRR